MTEGQGPLLEFVYIHLFERTARGVLTEGDLIALEWRLLANPRSGVLERHAGGVRKIRVAEERRLVRVLAERLRRE